MKSLQFTIKNNLPQFILFLASCLLLLIFLFWHYNLGVVRYFDVDELAHLHWTSQMLMGRKPYIDYLMFFPPGFMWLLSPAFIWGWGSITPFITARILMFIVFTLTCGFTGLIFWELRRSWTAILAMLFLAFLPLPFDKYLEIRPDNPATLFMLVAIYFQILWIRRKNDLYGFVSGICYSLSLIVLTKMLPNVLIGVIVAIIYGLTQIESGLKRIGLMNFLRRLWMSLKFFITGLLVPGVLVLLWLMSLGDFSVVWYSLTKLPVEANKISRYFIMQPSLFFYPNEIFYGLAGWSRGLVVNHTLWIVGLLVGIYRLLTPYNFEISNIKNQISKINIKNQKESNALSEALVAGQFIIQVIFYVLFVPLKHAQYLIPIGVFVAFYIADGLVMMWKQVVGNRKLEVIYMVILALGLIYMYQVFGETTYKKAGWSNKDMLSKVDNLNKKIPHNEYVLDLDGMMLYNRDPYYACCIPFGQFSEFLSRPLPDLSSALEQTKTKYINQGGLKRVNTLPYNDQVYINSNYHTYFGDEMILVRNGVEQRL